MPECRKYSVTINVFSLEKKDYDKKLNKAINDIKDAGLESEIHNSSSFINILSGLSTYNAVVKGYKVVKSFDEEENDCESII